MAEFKQGYALIVGVGADLPTTIHDAQGLAEVLCDPERCAYPPNQVTVLTGPQATRQHILDALRRLAATTTPETTVVIYFSGHGYQVKAPMGTFYYLMPHGYNQMELAETAISAEEFRQLVTAIPAQKRLLILDCCHAGGVGQEKSPSWMEMVKTPLPLPPEVLSRLAQGKGEVLLASSRDNEKSLAAKPYSLFTRALIEGLCGRGASRQDGYVRVADLALHARQVVPQWSRERQHPILHFEHADNFPLAYYAGGQPQAKGLPFPEFDPETDGPDTVEKPSTFDQRGQTVHGSQTNIETANGPVYSGTSGPIEHRTVTAHSGGVAVGGNVHGGIHAYTGGATPTPAAPPSAESLQQLIGAIQGSIASILANGEANQGQAEDLRAALDIVRREFGAPHPDGARIRRKLAEVHEILTSARSIAMAARRPHANVTALLTEADKAIGMASRLFQEPHTP